MDLELTGHDHDPGNGAATSGARTRDQDAAGASTEAQQKSRGHRDVSDDGAEPANLWTESRSTHRRRTSGYGTASFDCNVTVRRQRNSREASSEPSEDDASDHGEQHHRAPSRLRWRVTLSDSGDDPGETRRATRRCRRSGSRHLHSSSRQNGRRRRSTRGSAHGSSTKDDSDGAVVHHASSRLHRIKPSTFDGSGSFETFWAYFENCAAYNRWNEADKLAHLKASLVGDAGQTLWDSDAAATSSLEKLTALLRSRYSGSRQADKYRMELRLRRRRPGESLSALH